MKKIYILLAGLLVLSTSCGVLRYEEHQSVVSQPVNTGIVSPTTADLNVGQTRISHSETFPNDKDNEFDPQYAREYTLTSAMVKYNADMIVGSLYDITTSKDGKTVTVTITGYPATYVNFRTTTPADTLLLKAATPSFDNTVLKTTTLLSQNWKYWENNLSFNYGWTKTNLGLEYTGGYRFNSLFQAGFGLGYHYWMGNMQMYNPYYESGYGYSSNQGSHYVPIFAQMKFYIFGKRRVNLVLGVSQGVGFNIIPNTPDVPYLVVGSHTRAEIGVNFRFGKKAGANLAFVLGTSPERDYDQSTEERELFYKTPARHFLYEGIKIGITF